MKYPKVDLHKKKSDALVIHCADPRFQEAYRSVIGKHDIYFDLIVAPGASLAVVDDPRVIKNIELLHSLHKFDRVHIMDHIECGAFGKVKDELHEHSKMLTKAAAKINRAMPKMRVITHLLGEKSELTLE